MSTNRDIHSDLVEACRKGDRLAQRKIYDLYAQAMFNTALRIIGNREEAEDVLQECFVKMFGSLDNFRGDASFGSWFKRIVVNASLNKVSRRKITTSSLDEEHDHVEEEVYEEQKIPYTVGDVQEAVSQLPDGYRSVFSLYMFEDYSHKEISDTLGMSESTSKSQLNRARKKVREWLINRKKHEN